MAELKCATRMFLPAAVLILLSVSSSAEDAKRCYWCGPLAEQVHRSQRAPSCGQELQETMCDPGYTHCAVVVTSPPYVESRLCVKFYQDECYSLYCNTSKTWRMICPCQGNLCNGQNTDRETRAFATLTKIVAKNKRSKRCLVGDKGFFPLTPRKKVVNENNTIVTAINETHSAMHTEEPTEQVEMMQTTSVINDVFEAHESENEVGNNIEEDTNIEQDGETEMQEDQPIDTDEAVAATEEVIKNLDEAANNVEQSKTTKTIDDIKTNSVTSTIAMLEENKDVDIHTVLIPAEFVQEKQDITEIPTITSKLPTSIEIELSVVQIKKPNDILPPPEALQQNVTPAKVTAPTMGTIEMITNTNHIEITTHSIKETFKNNSQTPEIKKTNTDSKEKDKKNGENQTTTLVHVWELLILVNILIYITLEF